MKPGILNVVLNRESIQEIAGEKKQYVARKISVISH